MAASDAVWPAMRGLTDDGIAIVRFAERRARLAGTHNPMHAARRQPAIPKPGMKGNA
jgi:hypothetical protein